jgi:hypothetical protein
MALIYNLGDMIEHEGNPGRWLAEYDPSASLR